MSTVVCWSKDRALVETLHAIAALTATVPVAFLASKALGVPWRPLTTAAVLVFAAVAVFAAKRSGRSGAVPTVGIATVVGLLALTAIRFVPLAGAPAPPGGDMAMHTLLARIALLHEVLPATQQPLYPGVPYGAYPLGFHGIVAWLATALGLVGASLLAIAWAQALFAAGILVHAMRWVSAPIAVATALVASFALRNPQAYVGWGGNPCVLGFAFGLFAVDAVRRAVDRPTPLGIAGAALLVAATAVTHATAAVVLAVALVGLAIARVARRRNSRDVAVLSGIAAAALVLALPWILDVLATEFSRAEAEWIREHHLLPPQSPKPALLLLPDYWKYLGGDVALVIGALGVVAGIFLDRQRTILALAAVVGLPHLAILYRHSGWPGDTVIYPERALLVLVVPWAYLLTQVFVIAGRPVGTRWRTASIVLVAAACLAVSAMNSTKYYFQPASIDSVDEADRRAFDVLAEWGAERVRNSTGDPAAFLPALRSIPVTRPQWNPIWRDELEAWRQKAPPDFLYSRAGPDSVVVRPLDASP